MRIYDGDFSVRELVRECRADAPMNHSTFELGSAVVTTDIDIDKLNKRLATLPVDEIKRRRQRMNTFYEEVLVSRDPERGIEFSALLMILAHYKVIDDNKSLRYVLSTQPNDLQLIQPVSRNSSDGEHDCSAFTTPCRGTQSLASLIRCTGRDNSVRKSRRNVARGQCKAQPSTYRKSKCTMNQTILSTLADQTLRLTVH